MGVFLHHEPCPRCGSRDNLGRYADGSAWCFGGCGYREKANRVPIYNPQWLEKDDEAIILDEDLCNEYPSHVVAWLNSYGITVREALIYGWKYSPRRDQLVFIWYDEAGNPTLTQARNFWSRSKVKYFTQGPTQQILPIFRGMEQRQLQRSRLVVVEDVVSAAKIARQCDAMSCLGSTLSLSKQARLRALGYQQMVLWLDSDKLGNAMRISSQARLLGFETKVVYTPLDPKEYDDGEITRRLENSP